jgi:Zn-dependent peptidase ImmA (M78 family)
MGLKDHERLAAEDLAACLSIKIIAPRDVPELPLSVIHQLATDSESWSAITLSFESTHLIIHNPDHAPARQQSNLMHEIAHVICGHKPSKFIQVGGLPISIRTCDQEIENEAAWLGGCLQIPRDAVIWALRRQMSTADIAAYYGSSQLLAKYRIDVTGARAQIARTKARRSA